MSAEKDIDRIRELILGTEIVRFEKRFESIEKQLSSIKEEQVFFNSKMVKKHHKVVKHFENHIYDVDSKLKTFKTELKMFIESRLNNLDKKKISNKELSEMFATFSKELIEDDDAQRYAK